LQLPVYADQLQALVPQQTGCCIHIRVDRAGINQADAAAGGTLLHTCLLLFQLLLPVMHLSLLLGIVLVLSSVTKKLVWLEARRIHDLLPWSQLCWWVKFLGLANHWPGSAGLVRGWE
jgi:hypothetical protein